MGKLKFGSSKSEFGLRSGSTNKGGLPFKQMASSPAKIDLVSGQFGIGKNPGGESDMMKLSRWDKEAKTEKTAKDVQKVKDKTEKDVSTSEKSILAKNKWKKEHELNVRKQDFKEKVYEEGKTSKKTGPSIEQQLADRKLKDLQTKKTRLGEKGYSKGWSEKKLARKEKRLNKKITKAEKMTDPLNRAEHDLKEARWLDAAAQDPKQTQQNLVKARHRDSQVNQDVETVEKVENQEELPNPQTVDPDSYITASTGESRTGSEIMGGIETPDYSTWSDEDLEKRRTDPTYRPS